MTDHTILACPFCGDQDVSLQEIDLETFAVCCEACGVIGPIENYDRAKQSPERAVELWNKRGA